MYIGSSDVLEDQDRSGSGWVGVTVAAVMHVHKTRAANATGKGMLP